MKNILNLFNKRAFLITIFIWLILNIFGIQKAYFWGGDIFTTIIVKFLHVFFLYVIVSKVESLYSQRHKPEIKKEIIWDVIYCLIAMIALILSWPGAWATDDVTVLVNAAVLQLTPWQHFFSGLFQILCLQTIPIPAGVMILQIIIASLIVGYCISNMSRLFAKNKKQSVILQITLGLITLFPPLVMYILSGFRMGVYSYLELLLVTKMIVIYKEKKEVSFSEVIKISLITIIISSWRTEGIYYPIFILILYLILGKKVIKRRLAITSFFIIMVISFSIGKINNLMIGDNDYSLTATTEAVCALVRNSDESDQKELEAINKVMDIDYIVQNPDKTGENCYWAKGVVKEYSKEEYSDYLKAYLKLAIKYPDVAFKSMWNIFLRAGSGLGEEGKQTTKNVVANTSGKTLELFDSRTRTAASWNRISVANLKAKLAINEDVRKSVISFLNGTDANGNLTIIHNIFWNLFIPFTLILICLINKLIKKEWFMVFLILTVVARIPIVFVTAPAEYFMYYLSAYLCTYILSAIVITEEIIQRKNNKKIKGLLCEKKY